MNLTSIKTLSLIVAIFITSYSCNDTRNRRANVTDSAENPVYTTNSTTDVSTTKTASGANFTSTNTTTSTTTQVVDATSETTDKTVLGISGCTISTDGTTNFKYPSNHLGKFNICKSSLPSSTSGATDIYIQTLNKITSERLCILPTYHTGSASIFIGEPRCLFLPDPKKIYKVDLLKNRVGYSGYNITGVIMMKDIVFQFPAPLGRMLSVDAYIDCIITLDKTGNPSKCQAFNSLGQFVYHTF